VSSDLHVVFGAGQVGTPLAQRLLAAGVSVRVARQSSAATPPGVERVTGDAADPAFCAEAARGAAVVYHCMNPAYSTREWERLVPRYMENLIAAARTANARLVVLDNLYMLGRTSGKPMNEDTPMNPCSRKGEIRARAARLLFDAHRRGDVRATTARASDFYGPGGRLTHFGDVFWKPALAGKPAQMLIDPDAVHTYHYIPDVVEGLATLGLSAADDVEGRAWMLPCAPAGTGRELVARFSRAFGSEIRLARLPALMRHIAGAFMPILREIEEMMYQWQEPFIVDDRRFRERFGVSPADPATAATATLEWARRAYATPVSGARTR
jgi:nucleoside-diphosphate-sugar epimerase